jgi:ERCC4-type nuclease
MIIILKVDNRERAVFQCIETQELLSKVFSSSWPIKVIYENLLIGDYIISLGDETILAVIERKTLKDYASSIRDGRQDNVNKLINLRENTDCDVYYLVEGTPNPSLTSVHSKMEYKSILSSIRRLQILKKIHIIDSKNIQTTVRELFFLCEIYSRLVCEKLIAPQLILGAVEKSMPTEEEKIKSNVLNSWMCLQKVGPITAARLMESYPLCCLTGNIDLLKNVDWTEKTKIKFLSSLPLISVKTAKSLVNEISPVEFIKEIMEDSPRVLNLESKKFGPVGVNKIKIHLSFYLGMNKNE